MVTHYLKGAAMTEEQTMEIRSLLTMYRLKYGATTRQVHIGERLILLDVGIFDHGVWFMREMRQHPGRIFFQAVVFDSGSPNPIKRFGIAEIATEPEEQVQWAIETLKELL